MKLLFINTLYAPHIGGGAEVVLQRTVEGLQQRAMTCACWPRDLNRACTSAMYVV